MARKINDSIRLNEQTAPGTPPTGTVEVYALADGKLYIKDDTGAQTDLTATGGGGGSTARSFFLA